LEVVFRLLGGAAGAVPRPGGAPLGIAVHLEMLLQHPRNWAFSGEMSANSFSAANACWIFPDLCMRSAYSNKISASLGYESLRRVELGQLQGGRLPAGALRGTLLHIAIALL